MSFQSVLLRHLVIIITIIITLIIMLVHDDGGLQSLTWVVTMGMTRPSFGLQIGCQRYANKLPVFCLCSLNDGLSSVAVAKLHI